MCLAEGALTCSNWREGSVPSSLGCRAPSERFSLQCCQQFHALPADNSAAKALVAKMPDHPQERLHRLVLRLDFQLEDRTIACCLLLETRLAYWTAENNFPWSARCVLGPSARIADAANRR